MEGPEGQVQIKVEGNVRTNSAEFVREALIAGLGIGLRPTWDIAAELEAGTLKVVLPQYRGCSSMAIYAVYPCRDYLPEKVNVFIDFLATLFSNEQWVKDTAITSAEPAIKPARGNGRALPALPAKAKGRGAAASAVS